MPFHRVGEAIFSLLTAREGITGGGVTVGTFTAGAAATTSVSDSNIRANSQVLIFPIDAPAGLLTRTKTCFVDTIAAGSFVFNVSASGSGAPAGTEDFAYIAVSES